MSKNTQNPQGQKPTSIREDLNKSYTHKNPPPQKPPPQPINQTPNNTNKTGK